MKYCPNCGSQINDDAVFCPNCGASVGNDSYGSQNINMNTRPAGDNTLSTLAKVFMIIATVISGFAIIPLAWCIPMTVSYYNKIKRCERIGTGFKVCVLLFVALLPGIFMLCDSEH